jgi:hypothetical protein
LPFQEANYGEPDGIGAARRAGGEDPVSPIVAGRPTEKLVARGLVEDPDHVEMGEPFDVL